MQLKLEATVIDLSEYSIRKEEVINLQKQEIKFKIRLSNLAIHLKKCLIKGLDDIGLSMEKVNYIDDFERN